jgi:DNA mismatch endonuclease, patch repair protein
MEGSKIKLVHPGPTSAAASAVGRANRKTDSQPEVAIRSLLHRQGYRFRKNPYLRIMGQRGIRPDIVFPGPMVAVFVDGCFWHSCPIHGTNPKSNVGYWAPKLKRNVERDRENDVRLRRAGWTVVRVWEHTPTDEAVAEITRAVRASHLHKAQQLANSCSSTIKKTRE